MSLDTIATAAELQSTHATILVQLLISNYFSRLSSVLIVHESNYSSALQKEYLHAVQQSFHNQSLHGNIVALQWMDASKLNDDELEEQVLQAVDRIVTEGFITILSNTVRFLHARYYATRYSYYRLHDKLYLFLTEHENPQSFIATEILQFYPHHLMIAPETSAAERTQTITTNSSLKSHTPRDHDINFELWTQKFVGAVGNLDPVLLDVFMPNKTFAKNVELYPYKLTNLERRSFRVGSVTYVPYVVTKYVAPGTGNVDPINSKHPNRSVYYAGSEAEVVKTFCYVRNCNLRAYGYGDENWGLVYDNGSSYGNLGGVYEQQVEMAIGCIYNWFNDATEQSNTITRSAVTIVGPAPDRFPAWRTNITPFNNDLWAFLGVTMLLCAMVFYFLSYTTFVMYGAMETQAFRHISAFEISLLDVFAIFVQQSSAPIGLGRFAARFFMTTLLCATITLENSYSGQLKSLLTVPLYTEPIDTTEKWSKTGWLWMAPAVNWVTSIVKSDLPLEKIMTKTFRAYDYGKMYNLTFEREMGTAVERLLSNTFSFGIYLTLDALKNKIILKDDVYFDWTRGVTIRGWPLMHEFNKHIRVCVESGLFIHWEEKMVFEHLDRTTQNVLLYMASGIKAKSAPETLTVHNISGALLILLIGYTAGLLAFLLEVFGYRFKEKIFDMKRQLLGEVRKTEFRQ